MEIEVLLDGGAYCTLSPVVLSRGCLHATGPYRCDNVRVARPRRARRTRRPTAPSAASARRRRVFAVEVHMDRVAEALGIDPVRLRESERAAARATRWPPARCSARTRAPSPCCARRCARSGFHRKRRAFARHEPRHRALALLPRRRLHRLRRGRCSPRGPRSSCGRAACASSSAAPRSARARGPTLAQIVAEALGCRSSGSRSPIPTPRAVPDSGPTVASRTCMVVGGLLKRVRRGAEGAPRRPLPGRVPEAPRPADRDAAVRAAAGVAWDDATYRGDAYATYGWGCDVVEVELDPVTYEVRPTRVTAVVEIGRAVNPAPGRGPDRGRHRAGPRLRAARGGRDARRAHGERPAHQLPHPDDARHAADRRHAPRERLRATARSARRASASCR